MGKRSPSKGVVIRRVTKPQPESATKSPPGFIAAWRQLIGRRGCPALPVRSGCKPRVPLTQLLPAFAVEALAACQRVGSQFLFRARGNIQVQVIKRFKDGSRLIRVPVRPKGDHHHITQWLELREIRVSVGRKGHRSQKLLLWTSLLDAQEYPAMELAKLYAQRWEHELYYRELKRQLRRSDVLASHTLETAAQEIAALVMASALVAVERARAAGGALPVLRLSFVKVLELLRPLWLTLELGGDILSERQKDQLVKRFEEHMKRCVTAKRRNRSCPRAVRRVVSKWPRLQYPHSVTTPFTFRLI